MNKNYLPYGKQSISDIDIEAVSKVLNSDWLTTGPQVQAFETAMADYIGTNHAVAVNSGTAALHTALFAAGIERGDEVIVPPMTFAATANAVVYLGAKPVFADVNRSSLLIDPQSVIEKITPATKVIMAVDYAGQACDYDSLKRIADEYDLILVADACHSLGGKWNNAPCGSQADLSVFSFHPVKPITTGEGGMVVADNKTFYDRMQIFRNHGITTDHRQRQEQSNWMYEMHSLGFNYRLSDLHCALGLSQLGRLDAFILRRREIATAYDAAFADCTALQPLETMPYNYHGYHLYVLRLQERNRIFQDLRSRGIGCNVHYIPVHLHPWYRKNLGTSEGMCPVAEEAFSEILSLPIYPDLERTDQEMVIEQLLELSAR